VPVADATAGYRLRALLEPLRLSLVPADGGGWQVRVEPADEAERERALRIVSEWASAEGRAEVEVEVDGEIQRLRAA